MSLEEMARARDNQLRRQRTRREILARANGQPYGMTDAAPLREHINALRKLGWGFMAIASLHGELTNSQVRQIALGNTEQANVRSARLLRIPLHYRVPASLPDDCWVPAAGALRRVEGLLALGWTHDHLREATGGYSTTRMLSSRNGRPVTMQAHNWRRIDRAFRALSTRPGPSQQTRSRSRTLGYPPPAAWDDIDDPRERPKGVAA